MIWCKDNCKNIKALFSQAKIYISNRKYCTVCKYWMETDVLRCSCCNQQLRTKERKKNRKTPSYVDFTIDHIPKKSTERHMMEKVTIYVTSEQKQYVKKNYLNLSKVCRAKIDEIRGISKFNEQKSMEVSK
jgi:hypothetical protein